MFLWTQFLKPNLFLLKSGGLLLFNSSNPICHHLSKLFSYFMISFFIVLSAVLQMIELVFFTPDKQVFLASLCLILQEFQFLVKVYCLVTNRKLLQEIFDFLNYEQLFQPTNQQQENLILRGLVLWRKNFLVLNVAAFITAFSWTLFPVLDNLTQQHELPYRCWFPYDTKISPFYEISYVYLFIHLWLGAFMTHNIDTLVTALMTFIGLQCDLICDNLKHIGYCQNDDFQSDFNKSLLHHKKILSLTTKCLNFFAIIVFIQVATISICIGVALLQLTLAPPFTTEFYHLLFYVLTILLQMFQYCWFGNEVLIKSNNIPISAFSMNFLDAPIKVKKALIFFIMRTQQPIKIPILKLSFLTLQTFIKILRTAWSYFTLLHEMSTAN